jgi:hypothetical protein
MDWYLLFHSLFSNLCWTFILNYLLIVSLLVSNLYWTFTLNYLLIVSLLVMIVWPLFIGTHNYAYHELMPFWALWILSITFIMDEWFIWCALKLGNKLQLHSFLDKKIRLTWCYQFIFQEMEAYIRGLIPNLAQLRDILPDFVPMYCRIAAHKFFFFCDPHRRGLHDWYLLVAWCCFMVILSIIWIFCYY